MKPSPSISRPLLSRRRVLPGAAFACLGVIAALRFVAVVPDDDMAPSVQRGDLVVIVPVSPRAGDVVAVVDPLDPTRWTLRRVEGIGGAIRYQDGVFHSSDGPTRVSELGRDAHGVTLREGGHLTRIAQEVRWELPETGIPDTHAFLGADARDVAMDSRWWGPLPLDALRGVVVARIGAPRSAWREWVDLR